MKHGDISNEVPPRIIVTLDVVATAEEKPHKRFGITYGTDVTYKWNLPMLSLLWDFGNRTGVVFELAAFGISQVDADDLIEKLERRGTSPFYHHEVYEEIEELVYSLPYRANLRGVLDIPGRTAMYGSWGMETEMLERGR